MSIEKKNIVNYTATLTERNRCYEVTTTIPPDGVSVTLWKRETITTHGESSITENAETRGMTFVDIMQNFPSIKLPDGRTLTPIDLWDANKALADMVENYFHAAKMEEEAAEAGFPPGFED